MTEAAVLEKTETDSTEATTTEVAAAAAETAKAEATAGAEVETGAATAETAGTEEKAKKESPWPDNWRDLIADGAGKDAEDLKKLTNKYGGPSGMAKALLAAQREISTRGLAKQKPEDPKDEKAMAEWRKSVGIPDSAEGYKLPEQVLKGMVDDDKPILAQFTEFAHKKGLTPDAVAGAAEWYVESQNAAAEIRAQKDTTEAEECEDALNTEWARAEYKGNMSLAGRFFESGPLGKFWHDLRDPTGRKLGSNPELVKWASEQGRNMFGDSVFANSDVAQKHDDRKKEIETIMNTDIRRYRAEKLDVEYAGILEKEALRKK